MLSRKILVVVWVLATAITVICFTGIFTSQKFIARLRTNDAESRENNTGTSKKKSPYQDALIVEVGSVKEKHLKTLSEPASLKKILRQITITAINLKNELPGQSKHLHFVLSNKSDYQIEQVQIEIDYLHSNGDVLFSKTILVDDLLPASILKLTVPNCKPSHQIKYRVSNIYMPVQNSAYKIV